MHPGEEWEEYNFNWVEEEERQAKWRAKYLAEEAKRAERMRARENYEFACFEVGAFLNVENVPSNFYPVRWVW